MIIDFDIKNKYSLKDLKATRIIQTEMDEFLRDKFPNIYFVKSKNVEEAIKETLEIIKSGKYDFIVNPIFQYKNAISRPKGFDIKNKCLYSQKFSASTKKKD
jgi:hypothetical protein